MSWIKKRARKSARTGEKKVEAREPPFAAPRLVSKAPAPRPAEAFPRFQSTASDELAPGNRDRFAAARLKLRRAYTPAQPVNDRWLFAGRRSLLGAMIRAIEDERVHTIAYGRRGIGKTSLMHVVADAAREARYLVSYVSCGATASFDETFRAIASDIPLMFHAAYGPKAPEAEEGGVFADLIRPGAISPRMAADLCSKVAGTRVLVILDEFDRARSQEFRRDVGEFLKNLSDRSVRVQLLMAGVADNIDDLLEAGVLLQRNLVAVEVPRMSSDEVRDLIRIGQEVSGLTFDEKATELLIAAANGLPYVASLLAQHAGLAALSEGRMAVERGDVVIAIDEAIAEMVGRIPRDAYENLSTLERFGGESLLPILARIGQSDTGRFTQDEIAATAGGPLEAARAQTVLDRLARDGVLVAPDGEGHGRYRFVEQSMAPLLWLIALRQGSEPAANGGGDRRTASERT